MSFSQCWANPKVTKLLRKVVNCFAVLCSMWTIYLFRTVRSSLSQICIIFLSFLGLTLWSLHSINTMGTSPKDKQKLWKSIKTKNLGSQTGSWELDFAISNLWKLTWIFLNGLKHSSCCSNLIKISKCGTLLVTSIEFISQFNCKYSWELWVKFQCQICITLSTKVSKLLAKLKENYKEPTKKLPRYNYGSYQLKRGILFYLKFGFLIKKEFGSILSSPMLKIIDIYCSLVYLCSLKS